MRIRKNQKLKMRRRIRAAKIEEGEFYPEARNRRKQAWRDATAERIRLERAAVAGTIFEGGRMEEGQALRHFKDLPKFGALYAELSGESDPDLFE